MKLLVQTQIGRQPKQYEYIFDQPLITIGRLEENDIQLPLSTISGFHAQILLEGNDPFLMDRGSVNGTFLNGRRLAGGEKKLLADGDVIRIQNFDILFSKSSDAQLDREATVAVARQMVMDVMSSGGSTKADSAQITESKDHLKSKIVTAGGVNQKTTVATKPYFWLIIAALIAIAVILLLFL